jgi:hypothetical protein
MKLERMMAYDVNVKHGGEGKFNVAFEEIPKVHVKEYYSHQLVHQCF